MEPKSVFSIGITAASAVAAAKTSSKVVHGSTSIPGPSSRRAAAWLKDSRSPWIATLTVSS
jgi:hypothetical protein